MVTTLLDVAYSQLKKRAEKIVATQKQMEEARNAVRDYVTSPQAVPIINALNYITQCTENACATLPPLPLEAYDACKKTLEQLNLPVGHYNTTENAPSTIEWLRGDRWNTANGKGPIDWTKILINTAGNHGSPISFNPHENAINLRNALNTDLTNTTKKYLNKTIRNTLNSNPALLQETQHLHKTVASILSNWERGEKVFGNSFVQIPEFHPPHQPARKTAELGEAERNYSELLYESQDLNSSFNLNLSQFRRETETLYDALMGALKTKGVDTQQLALIERGAKQNWWVPTWSTPSILTAVKDILADQRTITQILDDLTAELTQDPTEGTKVLWRSMMVDELNERTQWDVTT